MTQRSPDALLTFADLGLSQPVLAALADVGYESPSPIQAATIPVLLTGQDVIGQAQTGTGKTAAFALPFLSMLDVARREPQVLVLVPTRELAIQVAEAFQKYASKMPGLHVLPIYGGQSYTPQLNALRRGTHVIVGTPGRVMDHLERGTLDLATLRFVVLDEADEMLQMGFVDAIDHILGLAPVERQVALFSATLPAQIRRIAQKHLRSPREITLKGVARSFQIPQLYLHMSVLDNVLAAWHANQGSRHFLRPAHDADSVARSMDLLERFGLQSLAMQTVRELPGGVRKLLDIAMALTGQPKLLLLDEPTSGVSADEKYATMDTVVQAIERSQEQVSVVFVEHDMDIVRRYASRVAAFYSGRVIADGQAEQVITDPEVQRHVTGLAPASRSPSAHSAHREATV